MGVRGGIAVLGILVLGASLAGGWECGHAPPAEKPQRRKAGESFPPLPLPATPLRRSEKKNPPAPPVLVGKVVCGSDETWTRADNDVENLLRLAGQQLGVSYRAARTDLARFSYDPDEAPVLYITGVEPFVPDAAVRARLKEYLEKGGFLWLNASSGSPAFTKAAAEMLGTMYPDRALYPLYANHPLRTCFHGLPSVKVLHEGKEGSEAPDLRVLNLGCRAAAILSGTDLGCGWALHTHPFGARYVPEDAVRIGVNMIAYTIGWIEFGKLHGMTPVYGEKSKATGGRLCLGQIVHSGDWNPHPAALGRLLKQMAESTRAPVYLEAGTVDLKKDDLKNTPILYITGHYDPRLSPDETKKLRSFLQAGGTLVADSCCGSAAFTDAVRALIPAVVPAAKVERWPVSHTVYRVPFPMDSFAYGVPGVSDPPLEVALLNGLPAVIFSPFGLGAGWEGIPRPYTVALSAAQAPKLGVNLMTYLMTH